MLMKEAGINTMLECEKYVITPFDEMKVKKSLVPDKYNSQIIRFEDLIDVYDKL